MTNINLNNNNIEKLYELNDNSQSLDIVQQNLEAVKKIIPQAFDVDGKVKMDFLQQALGISKDNETNYNFSWYGKNAYQRFAYQTSTDSLKPCKEESVNWEDTQNLFIEADNLQALKLLQKSYANKVKCIYIDPPYNTGNDFIYKDNFNDSYNDYLIKTGQKNQDGNIISTDIDKAGAKHTNWLNMMYPRLLLAHNLLTEDGVIFISIDDNEQANLKKLCDEVFGESNFVGDIIRKTKSTTNDSKSGLNIQHENTLIYAKNKSICSLQGEKKTFENYKNPDNDPNGAWVVADPSARTGSIFEIINPHTGKIDHPPANRQWQFARTTFDKYVANGKIKFKKEHKPNERGFIFKRYRNEVMSDFSLVDTLFAIENEYMNQNATKTMNKLFSDFKPFDYTKPYNYIIKLVKYSTKENDIILDFFAGSGTTAHSVMQLNAKDGGNRKCISVQLPELTDEKSEAYKSGYKNIAEISKERIRRAGKQIAETNPNVDVGFKVYKLSQSNIKKWNGDFSNIDQDIFAGINRFIDGAKDEDIISELVLKFGLCITENINKFKYNDIQYYTVNGTGGIDLLFVCLSDKISINITDEIIKLKEKHDNIQVVFSDNSFTDCDRSNIEHTLKDSKITRVEFL